jgi:hypothetical protein
MNRLKLFGLLALLLSQAVEVSAASLDAVGKFDKYGNEAGCKFMATSEVAEDMTFLTAEGWGTYAMLCRFVEVTPAGNLTRVATAICAHEGEETQTIDMLRLEKDPNGADAWTIYNSAGDDWGKVSRCP